MDRGAWRAIVHGVGHKEADSAEAIEHACTHARISQS